MFNTDKNVKEIVNEKKRIVVTVIQDHFGKHVGKAKCNEGDTFDEVVGKKISHLRADIKAEQARKAEINYDIQEVTKLLNELNNQKQSSEKKIEKYKNKINKIFDSLK